MAWLFVPGLEALNSDSNSLLENATDAGFTWREKSLKPRAWLKLLERVSWIQRLSGMTLPQSMADDYAVKLICSREEYPVNPIAMPANEWESLTPEIYGLSLPDWYGRLRQASSSWRTFQASLDSITPTSDPTYRPWVTRLRRESSQRRRSARLIFGNASFGWPTARAHEAGDYQYSQGNHDMPTPTLSGASSQWPSPVKADGDRGSTTYDRGNPTLLGAALNWPTPSTAPEAPNTNSNTVNGPTSLGEAATLWQTPTAGGPQSHASQWATPMASDGTKPSAGTRRSSDLSHQAQETVTAGETTSNPADLRLLRPALKPSFVEALMGWPLGLTDYTSEGMESSRWLQRSRSVLSRLGLGC